MSKKYTRAKAKSEYNKLSKQIHKSDILTQIQYAPRMFFLKHKLRMKGVKL